MNKSKLFSENRSAIAEKIKEAACSVLPIVILVSLLCFSIAPINPDLMLNFFVGTIMVIVGIGLFSLGADTSMIPIGNKIGTALTKTKKLPLIVITSFAFGFAITVAEPDLQVLAHTVPHISNTILLVTVGVGVGFFLAVSMVRIITGFRLRWLLLIFYGIIFILASFIDDKFLSIAFDSGGVTTGPMTVPFILALGVGVSNIRSDDKAEADSFGLVALGSIGPVLAVLILGFFYSDTDAVAEVTSYTFNSTTAIGKAYFSGIPKYMGEVAISLLPVVLIFLLLQLIMLKISKRSLLKICVGLVYTYTGLVLFLTGVNVGFSSLGAVLGQELAESGMKYLMIPLAMIFGWFIISAEPAVKVLENQIEEVSAGAIPGKAIKISLSAAIAVAMGISMLRVLTGMSILWFLVPGYAAALIMSFFVPDIYTAIAFDSGGVASGPMTATFMLQFFIGASLALGGDVLKDAFGAVAMVAMMPLISIQTVGLIYTVRDKKNVKEVAEEYGDYDIIELWEENAI